MNLCVLSIILSAIVICLLIGSTNGSQVCLLKNQNSELDLTAMKNDENDWCSLYGIISVSEQSVLLKKLCSPKELSLLLSSKNPSLSVLSINNSQTIHQDETLKSICLDGPKGLLTWISWADYEEKVKPLIKIDENEMLSMVIKNSTIGIALASTDDNSNSQTDTKHSEVLIDILPNSYFFKNITYRNWQNITSIKTVELGTSTLENHSSMTRVLSDKIPYTFDGSVQTTFPTKNMIDQETVHVNAKKIQTFKIGGTTSYTESKIYELFYELEPLTKVEIVVEGTLVSIEYMIDGILESSFGYLNPNEKNMESQNIEGKVVETKLINIKHRNTQFNEEADEALNNDEKNYHEKLPEPSPVYVAHESVYPGFRPYFIVACLIVFGVLFVVLADIGRILYNEKKNSYQNSGRIYKSIATSAT